MSKTLDELKRIAAENDGVLRPADVVEAARPKNSILHSRFTWDNDEAAERYRLWQARQLISVTIDYIGPVRDDSDKMRVFVSLTPDRAAGGGYRVVEAVMMSPEDRNQMLADALDEMERFQKKYEDLKELAEVFSAMKRVRRPAKKDSAA
jgi:hypothetical protein